MKQIINGKTYNTETARCIRAEYDTRRTKMIDGYDYTARVIREDGKTKRTKTYATAKGARGEALRYLSGVGGRFDISYKISPEVGGNWTGGMVTGGESATVTADGIVRH